MTPKEYLASLSPGQHKVIDTFRNIILETDKAVDEKAGKIMSIDTALCYQQEGVFKYGLAITSHHYTFHSMILYSNTTLMDELKTKLKKVKFQKGCINFRSLDEFPADIFSELMKSSAKCDYSAIIAHYRKKKK